MTLVEHNAPVLRYLARHVHVDALPVEDEALIELRNRVSSDIGRGLTGLLGLLAVGAMIVLTFSWIL